MKKLLLILLFPSPFFSEAQTSVYHPFPEDSAKWCAKWCDGGLFLSSGATWQLNGKALINGNWYSRLRHYETLGSMVSFCIPGNDMSIDTTTYYIRQDTLLRKVWMYWPSTNSDTLFLSFDLALGDTLHFIYDSYTYIVTSIDSMLINGQYRLRYNYEATVNSSCNTSMVEGIGPLYGLTYQPGNCFERFAWLNYFEQNNQPVYTDSTNLPIFCHDFALQIAELNHNSFSISPNPTHNILNVQCSFPNAELKIYNMTGREVMEQRLNQPLSVIHFQLANGVYVARLVSQSQSPVANVKFVVQ